MAVFPAENKKKKLAKFLYSLLFTKNANIKNEASSEEQKPVLKLHVVSSWTLDSVSIYFQKEKKTLSLFN